MKSLWHPSLLIAFVSSELLLVTLNIFAANILATRIRLIRLRKLVRFCHSEAVVDMPAAGMSIRERRR